MPRWEYKQLLALGEHNGQVMARELTAPPTSPQAVGPLQSMLDGFVAQGFEVDSVMPRSIQTATAQTTQLVYTLKRAKE